MTTIPPLPPNVPRDHNAPLRTTEGLRAGDVLQVAIQLTDKMNGQPFWWKRFVCVIRVYNRRRFKAFTLKMKPNLSDDGFDSDIREIDLSERMEQQVVTLVPERIQPQGVIAMRMKAIHMGWIKLGDEE